MRHRNSSSFRKHTRYEIDVGKNKTWMQDAVHVATRAVTCNESNKIDNRAASDDLKPAQLWRLVVDTIY